MKTKTKTKTKITRLLTPGTKVLIRTVTAYQTGEVVAVYAGTGTVLLRHGAWIADTGRFSAALKTGVLSEVEPVPGDGLMEVGLGAIADVVAWPHGLPRVAQ